jgi:hypothetical protein
MPGYIVGGGAQKTSTNPAVQDVYQSANVFVNNVPVVPYGPPGASGTFGAVSVSVSVSLDPAVEEAATAQVNTYIAAQNGQPNQYYQPAAAADGVKGNYAGTVDDGTVATTATSTVATDASFSDISAFLTQCLNEAAQGKWRETGQGGKPSNPTITGIWQNLGYKNNSPWNTDQTAWCMGFVNYALKSSGYRYFQTASAAAITTNPEKWGAVQVPKDQAQPGDIAFWSYRHVNFVYTVQNGKYTFVGGNQTPSGGKNNPDDGDITKSYPGGTPASNANWVSCWRPTKS